MYPTTRTRCQMHWHCCCSSLRHVTTGTNTSIFGYLFIRPRVLSLNKTILFTIIIIPYIQKNNIKYRWDFFYLFLNSPVGWKQCDWINRAKRPHNNNVSKSTEWEGKGGILFMECMNVYGCQIIWLFVHDEVNAPAKNDVVILSRIPSMLSDSQGVGLNLSDSTLVEWRSRLRVLQTNRVHLFSA